MSKISPEGPSQAETHEVVNPFADKIDKRRATYVSAEGKNYYFSVNALGCLHLENPVRKFAMAAITNKWFDRTILLLIVFNSIIMALTDYSVIDDSYTPVSEWEGQKSWRNGIAEKMEIPFLCFFFIEMALKILGMGFWLERYPGKDIHDDSFSVGRPDTYLRDSWNNLDFIVVVTGFAEYLPGGFLPNVSVIRTFRVLRPLKSVAGLDGVKMVLVAVGNSIPELMSVIVLLFFVFAIFGILGLQFFMGLTHSRCRLTPYPVTRDWMQGMNYSDYQCATVNFGSKYAGTSSNFDTQLQQPTWNKGNSIWHEPTDCYWPLDESDDRLCSFRGSNEGDHLCASAAFYRHKILPLNDDKSPTWCGSNWDAMGNPRFKGAQKEPLDIYGGNHTESGRAYDQEMLLYSANYVDSFQFGYIDFDHLGRGIVTIFQVITLEGWTDIMYMLQDVYNPLATAIFFVLFVVFGSFFVLNLLLAVLEQNYNDEEQKMSERKEWEAIELAKDEAALLNQQLEALASVSDEVIGANIDENAGWTSDFPMGEINFGQMLEEDTKLNKNPLLKYCGWCILDPDSEEAQHRPAYRQFLFDLVEHPKFSLFITLCIVLNTCALAADHHPMNASFEEGLEIVNFVFTLIFALEMFLKLPGLGIRLYARDPFNIFDCIIVLISIVETIVTPPTFIKKSDGASGGGISALRSFRLFRIFKLAREWEAMRQLLDLIVKTGMQMSNFLLLFFLFIYIYALLGMQFFAGRMHFDSDGYPVSLNSGGDRYAWEYESEIPRANFDTLLWAATTIFSILSGENWNTVMYDGMRAVGYYGAAYFITLVVFGNFIVMNIFMAILLANFDELGVSHDEEEDGDGAAKVAPEVLDPMEQLKLGLEQGEKSDAQLRKELHADAVAARPGSQIARNGAATQVTSAVASLVGGEENKEPPPERIHVLDSKWEGKGDPAPYTYKQNGEAAGKGAAGGSGSGGGGGVVMEADGMPPSLNPDGDPSCLKAVCYKIVTNSIFDQFIMVCILISTLAIVLDNPLDSPHTALYLCLVLLDFFLMVVFAVEMVLKIIALNLWSGKQAYMKSGWNLMDGAIVIMGFLSLVPGLSALKALRAVRALKPLRMINRYPGLQVVVGTMISSVGAIANVAIVVLLVFVIFSIMAVNYLKGKFWQCMGDNFDTMVDAPSEPTAYEEFLIAPKAWSRMTSEEKSWFQAGSPVLDMYDLDFDGSGDNPSCESNGFGCCPFDYSDDAVKPTSKEICECWVMDWERSLYMRFDNTWVALGCLFQISTTEGWVDVMIAAVDAPNEIDMQPIVNNNEAFWITFFFFFMILGSFLMTNLFVGVIIQNFNELKEQKDRESKMSGVDEGELLMSDEQKSWTMTQQILASMIEMKCHRPKPPRGGGGLLPLRKFCFDVVQQDWFDQAIIGCIIANTLCMCLNYFGMDDGLIFALEVANFIFAQIFNLECIFKVMALDIGYIYTMIGTRRVYNNWNIFDFVIVLGTNLGMIISPPFSKGGGGGGGVATTIRMFRIGRLLRLINGAQDIKKMFDTLILTLPGLSNVAAVVALLFLIFAVVGVQLFATVAYHESLSPHANFRSFWVALLTLFRFSTGENWNGFMYESAHGNYAGFSGTEESLESDASNPSAPSNSGSGFCDPEPLYDDKFVGGPYDGLKYGDTMCGFYRTQRISLFATQADGCVELNGCSNGAIFFYLKAFTLLITFVFLNLFVGIILDGFSQAEEQGGASTISEIEFKKIWTHWIENYDPEETYTIDFYKVKSFLQTLDTPWGFGLDYVATDAELILRVKDLNLTVGPDGKIHFFKVLKGLSRRHLILTEKLAMVEEIDALESSQQGFDQKLHLMKEHASIPNFFKSADLTADLKHVSEMEDLTNILARMVIRKSIKKYLRNRATVAGVKSQVAKARSREVGPGGGGDGGVGGGEGSSGRGIEDAARGRSNSPGPVDEEGLARHEDNLDMESIGERSTGSSAH